MPFPSASDDEERQERELDDAIHERLTSLRDVGASGVPGRIARGDPMRTIYQGRPSDFDPSLGSYSKHWSSDIRSAQNFGPNIYAAQVRESTWKASVEPTLQANPNIDPKFVAMGLERHLPLSFAKGAAPVSVARGVPAPALIPPQSMPQHVEAPGRIAGAQNVVDSLRSNFLARETALEPFRAHAMGGTPEIQRGVFEYET